ncbi:MAG: hypothetical protein HN341_19445 [Verrucomicrobia bacterium]|nr:hypothetical protein [Verrucomicrobiota bacterium]
MNSARNRTQDGLRANQERMRIRDQARIRHGVAAWKLKGVKNGLRYRVRMNDGRCGRCFVHVDGKIELDIPALPVGDPLRANPDVRAADLLQPAMLRDIVSRLGEMHEFSTKPKGLRDKVWSPGQSTS